MTVLKLSSIVVGVLVLSGVGYLQHPVFGQIPEGERLRQIQDSPNYTDGEFKNLIETPMLTTDQSQLSMMLENLIGGNDNTRPPVALPSVKTDLHALNPARDVVIWLGHSSYYVQLNGQRILIDPVFSTNASPVPMTVTAFDGTDVYTADDMPPIDLLLITHDHYDHLDYPSVMALRSKVDQVIAGLGIGAHLTGWGYEREQIVQADWNDSFEVAPGLQIIVTPARHYSGRLFSKNQALWVGFALIAPQHRLFFSGDSGFGPHFTDIGEQYGPFDWVTLDAGQYDPRWANIHMNPEQAAQAANDLGALALTPAHVGRFTISQHDWDDPFKRLETASQDYDYSLWTPMIGQPVYFDSQTQEFTAWWERESAPGPAESVTHHESPTHQQEPNAG
ncbi:MBL fold metallo-hydrolase [Marinobacter sp. AN1]|uniref:MBL fold metallo-hydrolase n=1 Tax=Marinobacter sp. AN1 TaxID=2886046 RepID=UPI002230E1ED|nr:MBL fold metallo-hydrolase [Marinobacter sp. AN1]UZD65695.1 MBL fold metallo-hydrolase [Marinobacter sp. AN1]